MAIWIPTATAPIPHNEGQLQERRPTSTHITTWIPTATAPI